MLAYKGFSSDLQALMGKSRFQFEPGKTYEETECDSHQQGWLWEIHRFI